MGCETESIHRVMEICFSNEIQPGWVKFQYRRFFNSQQLSDAFVWCRNKADFLSLLFYWSGTNWEYKPALDRSGYILGGE